MKLFHLIIIAQGFSSITLTGCPYEFSPDDTRPFFEQYVNKISSQKSNEKEKSHEKNSNTHTQSTDNTPSCKS